MHQLIEHLELNKICLVGLSKEIRLAIEKYRG